MIYDIILKNYLDNFSEDFNYKLKEPEQFERFVNYIVFSRQYVNKITPDLIDIVSTGNGQDTGFDGIGIIVNGSLIRNISELEYFLEKDYNLKISFIFVQTKARSHFRAESVGHFYDGIKNFFKHESLLTENEEIKNFREIKNKIYDNTLKFDGNPDLYTYYATAGEWKEPKDINAKKLDFLDNMKKEKIFNNINSYFIDTDKLKLWYQEIKRKNIKEINFINKVALPDISDVTQSFIGSLPMDEFIKMITDSDGNLQKNLFDDNVRHFQGKTNKINNEIEDTLKDKSIQGALPIFNNGITVITKKLEQTGNKLRLTDFQIVNGCQSAHVFFNNKDIIDAKTNIIIKIIETNNSNLINKIIKATNKQTLVTDEAFESLAAFHRNLEEYYDARASKISIPIYYERRSKQYENDPRKIKSVQIVTLAGQVQAFVATVLAQPHSTHRYYGELLNANRDKLFQENHTSDLYYISSLILNRIDNLFRSKKINSKYRNYRFQIAYLAYNYLQELKHRDKKINYDKIILMLDNIDEYKEIFDLCCKIIDEESNKYKHRDKKELHLYRLSKFTESLRENIQNQFKGVK